MGSDGISEDQPRDRKPKDRDYEVGSFNRALCPIHNFPMYETDRDYGCPKCTNEKYGFGFG